MKRILKRVLIILLILLTLNNFLINSVQADVADALGKGISEFLDHGVIGVLTLIYKVPMLILGGLLNRFSSAVAWAEGSTDPTYDTTGLVTKTVTIYDILFNKVKLIDINFFDIKDGDSSLVNQFRVSVAGWFYIMRTIAAGILLVILVYVGIRMAVSTVASDRAMYKRMLVDWAASLALIFILQYIIIFVLEVNNGIVNAININGESGTLLSAAITTLRQKGWFGSGIISLVSAYIYIMLSWQTIGLFFSYFNRMLKLAFLIIISPLISLTYSIDKMGDGKAQALDAWLKEFVFTVLMQPFHCIIYMSLISAALNILIQKSQTWDNLTETLGAAILACVCISFTKEAEKIVRKIFAFKDDNKNTSLAAGVAAASMVLNKAQSFGKSSIKTVNGARNFVKNTAGAMTLTNIRAEARAFKSFMKSDNEKSYATLKSEAKADIYEARAQKISGGDEASLEKFFSETQNAEKNAQGIAVNAVAYDTALKQEETRLREEAERTGKPVYDGEIKSLAKLNIAKQARTQQVGWRRNISGATAKVKGATEGAKRFGRKINNAIPMKETRKLLMKSALPNSMAMFIGAGSYGLSGNLVNSVVAANATKKAYKEFTSGTVGEIKSKNDLLLDQYMYDEDSSKNQEMKKDEQQRAATLAQIANSTIYSDSDEMKKYIEERLRDLDFSDSQEVSNIANEIVSEVQNADFDIDNVGEKVLQIVENHSTNGSSINGQKQRTARRELYNFGIGYGISQNISAGESAGISRDIITGSSQSVIGTKILNEEKENAEIVHRSTITEGDKVKVKNMSPAQLAALNRMFERQVTTILSIPNETGSEQLREQLERRAAEIEKKRDALIVEAIASTDSKLEGLRKELAISIYNEKKAELNAFAKTDEEKKEIEDILKKLEDALNKV